MRSVAGAVLLVVALATSVEAAVRVPFSGVIDLEASHAQLSVGHPEGPHFVDVDLTRTGTMQYRVVLNAAHLPSPLGDLNGSVEGTWRLSGDAPRSREVTGELKTRDLLLDYKPLPDATASFAVREGRLLMGPCWAGGVSWKGWFDLRGKKAFGLDIDIISTDIEELVAFARCVYPPAARADVGLGGTLKGSLRLAGNWPGTDMQGHLVAYNGHFKALHYDSIVVDFDGQYPQVNVREALLTRAQGLAFRLSGMLDLSDMDALTSQLKGFSRAPVIVTDLGRREWVFRRLEGASDEMKTEMKYFFRKDDRGDTEAVLGVQKSIGF